MSVKTNKAMAMQGNDSKDRQEIFSNVVRAGRRTYFFDVKKTRKGDLYLTITESKKVFDDGGKFHFEKHKLFLYKEDFDKFSEAYDNVVNFIDENVDDFLENPDMESPNQKSEPVNDVTDVDGDKSDNESLETGDTTSDDFTDVDFDDLDKS
ncbi:MAG: DUF3276 family protein [Bacteroidota bacterium]|nr:DUF3276 family protein [Bacteroidota bacterium]